MRFEAILFDFDGVLLESEAAGNRHLATYLSALGKPTTPEQAMAAFMGLAGGAGQAAAWLADGVHGRARAHAARPLLRTAPAHDSRELAAARAAGAAIAFVSPVFATRTHPGAPTLGPLRFAGLARRARGMMVIALGGMDESRFRRLRALGAEGWAAIDAWQR